jgi:hypothetical protein
VTYSSSKRRNHFSRVSVGMALNVIAHTRLKSMMPKHLLALIAQETRERYLLGAKLLLCPYPMDEISAFSWDGVNVKVHLKDISGEGVGINGIRRALRREYNWQPNGTAASTTEPIVVPTPSDKDGDCSGVSTTAAGETAQSPIAENVYNPYFTYGNTVILDWGQIVPSGHFHNRTQLYPLGFKCIRQEIDTKLNRLVDCLCEIDFTIQVII